MSVTIFSHPACNKHNLGSDHPEQPGRLHAIFDQLLSSGVDYAVSHQTATQATDEQLALAHDKAYIRHVIAKNPTEGSVWLDDDTAMMNRSLDAARFAAGAAINAVDWVMHRDNAQVFCAIRPPGHHAESAQAMGFCFFNNIAIAAKYALQHYQLSRVLILDFDVHHGNGTEQIVKGDDRILFCSSFEYPFYPHPDLAETDNILKLPLAAGSDGEAFRRGVTSKWLDKIEAFAPELVLISAGFDAHYEDEMANLKWQEADYVWIAEQLKKIAIRSSNGRIVACLEGGYSHSALGRSVVAMLKVWL